MAKFFVGQRVRIVRTGFHPELLGREARIIEPFKECRSLAFGSWSGWPLDLKTSDGKDIVAHEDALEPILPSGHTAGTECFQELMGRLNTEKVERVEEAAA